MKLFFNFHKYLFLTLSLFSDIIAIVITVGEPVAVTRKSDGEEVVRRDVTIIDHSYVKKKS